MTTPAKKKGKTLKVKGLVLNLPDKLTSEIIWIMAEADESDSAFAEATMLAKMIRATLGEEQAQKVRDKDLTVDELANLFIEIQGSYEVEPGK
jgi:hypothetical protein